MGVRKKKILVIGVLPIEGGGRHTSGLSYSIWNNIQNIATEDLDVRFLASDVCLREIALGTVRSYPFRLHQLWPGVFFFPWALIKVGTTPHLTKSYTDFGRCFWFKAAIQHFNPDLVHVHGAIAAYMVRSLFPAKRLLVTLHGTMGDAFPGARTVEKVAVKSADHLVTVTERTFFQLEGHQEFSQPRSVIPNGVDFTYFRRQPCCSKPQSAEKFRLLTVASLTANKNHKMVLIAIHACGHQEKFSYVTIGDGPERSNLQDLAIKLGVDYQNIPLISHSLLVSYYQKADFTILSSIQEGFGMCIAESIACGTPVILPRHLDIVGETQIVRPENSILFEGGTTQSLSSVFRKIATGEVSFDTRSISYPYGWRDIAQRYERLYHELTEP